MTPDSLREKARAVARRFIISHGGPDLLTDAILAFAKEVAEEAVRASRPKFKELTGTEVPADELAAAKKFADFDGKEQMMWGWQSVHREVHVLYHALLKAEARLAAAMKEVAEDEVRGNPLLAFKVDHRSSGHCIVHGNFACGWTGDRSPGGCGLCDRERIEKLAAKLHAFTSATPDSPEVKEVLAHVEGTCDRKNCHHEYVHKNVKVLARALRAAEAKLDEMTKERDAWKEDCETIGDCGHPVVCVEHQQGPEDADEVCLWCAQVGAAEQVAEYEKGLLFEQVATLTAALGRAREAFEAIKSEAYGMRQMSVMLDRAISALAALPPLPADAKGEK